MKNAQTLNEEAIAIRLCDALEQEAAQFGRPFADIDRLANTVEFEIEGSRYARFTIECFGPDAFSFYPAVRNGQNIMWLNVPATPEKASTLDEVVAFFDSELAAVAGPETKPGHL